MGDDPGGSEGFFGERVAAADLGSGGRFVIEARVPELQRLPLGQTVLPWRADPSGTTAYVYDVVTQRLSGQHYVEP